MVNNPFDYRPQEPKKIQKDTPEAHLLTAQDGPLGFLLALL